MIIGRYLSRVEKEWRRSGEGGGMGWTGHGEDMGREFFCEKNDFGCVLIVNVL